MSERLYAQFVVPMQRRWDVQNHRFYDELPPVTECCDATGSSGILLLDARYSKENQIAHAKRYAVNANTRRNAGYIGFWIGKGIGEKPPKTPIVFLDGVSPLKHVRGCDL